MHQAVMSFGAAPAGFYKVGSAGSESAVFPVAPTPARSEVFAVLGDFGLAHDECMADMVRGAAAGEFDSVLHVGDWAYNFEDGASATGNLFMGLMQGYAATKPVMPAAGNHEACGACAGIPELPLSANNFTQYRARMHAVTLNAGKNAGTNSNRYYSFNQGMTHFLVFSAEAYVYARDATFLANQLAFMKADLAAVDRKVTPWVIALVHKDWRMQPDAYAAFNSVLEAGGVDVLFCGHVHYYNRDAPFDAVTNDVDNAAVSADGHTYTNPKRSEERRVGKECE
jgi:predicted phosphohydrolase